MATLNHGTSAQRPIPSHAVVSSILADVLDAATSKPHPLHRQPQQPVIIDLDMEDQAPQPTAVISIVDDDVHPVVAPIPSNSFSAIPIVEEVTPPPLQNEIEKQISVDTPVNNPLNNDNAFNNAINLLPHLANIPHIPDPNYNIDITPDDVDVDGGGADNAAAEDDDDDIEIVSTAIVRPLISPYQQHQHQQAAQNQTIAIDVDDDDALPQPLPVAQYAASRQTAQDDSDEINMITPMPVNVHQHSAMPTNAVPISEDIIECVPVQAKPTPILNGEVTSSDVDIIEESQVRETCSCCKKVLSDEQHLISRCKHKLCPSCMLTAVIDTEIEKKKEPMLAIHQLLTAAASSSKNTKASSKSKAKTTKSTRASKSKKKHIDLSNELFQAKTLRNIPVCPVPRCSAPFTTTEVLSALVPQTADDSFLSELEQFNKWLNYSSSSDFGPSHVSFPSYEPEPEPEPEPPSSITISTTSAFEASTENQEDVQDNLLEDDLAMSYSPLWVWDKEMLTVSGTGAWVCLACGESSEPGIPTQSNSNAIEESEINVGPSTLVNGDKGHTTNAHECSINEIICENTHTADEINESHAPEEGDSKVPDPPLYAHCSYARALGVVETIKGLSEARGGKKKRRRKSVSTLKRYRSAAAIRHAKRRKIDSDGNEFIQGKAGFAKGTGYAGSSRQEWRGQTSKQIQEKAKIDQAVTYWLLKIRCFLLLNADAPLKSWPGFMRLLLREKGLIVYLSEILLNESIMDIQSRVPVYVAALRLVHAICEAPSLRILATDPPDLSVINSDEKDDKTKESDSTDNNARSSGIAGGTKTIAELVESLSKQAALYSTGVTSDDLAKGTQMLIKQIRRCIRLINRHDLLSVAKQRRAAEKEKETKKIENANQPTDVTANDNQENGENGVTDPDNETRRRSKRLSQKPDSKEENNDQNEEKDGSEDVIKMDEDNKQAVDDFSKDKEMYIEEMKKYQFTTEVGLAQTSVFYQDAVKAQQTSVPSSKRQRRIASEVATLMSSLPLSWSSSILLRVDEDRFDFLRAVIFGPEDTPYDSGAFVFDIWLPLEYPSIPPKFQLLTTGSGRVRFNPNLYNSGKVCLSLLGTWSGPSWTPASTVWQVLVSIQSLILVPEPYFNEPGYERQMGSLSGKTQSNRYNERVRTDCALYAMQYNLRHPSPDLDDALTAHFRLKKRYVTEHLFNLWFPQTIAALRTMGKAQNNTSQAEQVNKASTSNSLQNIMNSTTDMTPNAAVSADPDATGGNAVSKQHASSSSLFAVTQSGPAPTAANTSSQGVTPASAAMLAVDNLLSQSMYFNGTSNGMPIPNVPTPTPPSHLQSPAVVQAPGVRNNYRQYMMSPSILESILADFEKLTIPF